MSALKDTDKDLTGKVSVTAFDKAQKSIDLNKALKPIEDSVNKTMKQFKMTSPFAG